MKVAVVNHLDTREVGVLSGASYFMTRALERNGIEITHLGPLSSNWLRMSRYLHGAARLIGRSYDWHHNQLASRGFGREFARRVNMGSYDAIFAPLASTEVAFLETKLPIVYLTDMTLASGRSYYEALSNLLPFTEHGGDEIERKATERAKAIVCPSKWVKESLERDYSCDASRIHVVPYGANLKDPPTREESLAERNTEVCRLLLLGVNWERKGGPLALQILGKLLELGTNAELWVCGCEPPAGITHPAMKVLPFLRKNDPQDALELRRLLLSATFLLVPSKAEAWGFVYGEASACGLPSVARDTGGVSSVVTDQVNGLLLPPDASPKDYASRICEVLHQAGRYGELCKSSREEYESRLNWDRWGTRMSEIFSEVIETTAH